MTGSRGYEFVMTDPTEPLPCGIAIPKFQHALAAGDLRFARIKDRYPRLKGYLVLSSPNGQTETDNGLPKMIGEFPELFLDSVVKTQMRDLVRDLRLAEKQKEEAEIEQRPKLQERIETQHERIRDISCNLIVDGSCHIEIRFRHLDYDLIWKLQTDEGVDRELTPQSRASIRIVLGTISKFTQIKP